jgi:lipid-A-disaccharide synthase
VPHIGLPNLVLGERAFPELVQRAATGARLADTACALLADRPRAVARCASVRRELQKGLDRRTPAERVAAMVSPWLA